MFAYVLITTPKREICSYLCVENSGRYGSQYIATNGNGCFGRRGCVCVLNLNVVEQVHIGSLTYNSFGRRVSDIQCPPISC